MRPFSCAGCAARDSEIAHLRQMVQQLQDKVVNIVDPAVHARLAHAEALAKQMRERPEDPPSSPEPSPYDRRRAGIIQAPPGLEQPESGTAEARFRKGAWADATTQSGGKGA